RGTVVLECDDEARYHLHGGVELDGSAAGIRDMQRAALVRHLDPFCRQAGFVEERLGFPQILFAENAHADPLGLRVTAAALEHEAMVTGLGDAAEIERVLVLVADDEAEKIHVEISAHRQVFHRQHRVAGTCEIERRLLDRRRRARWALPPPISKRTALAQLCLQQNQLPSPPPYHPRPPLP